MFPSPLPLWVGGAVFVCVFVKQVALPQLPLISRFGFLAGPFFAYRIWRSFMLLLHTFSINKLCAHMAHTPCGVCLSCLLFSDFCLLLCRLSSGANMLAQIFDTSTDTQTGTLTDTDTDTATHIHMTTHKHRADTDRDNNGGADPPPSAPPITQTQKFPGVGLFTRELGT